MRELFRKYIDNNCSPTEVRRLLAHFNIDENETLLRKLITDWLEENEEEEDDSRWQANFYEVLGLIKKQLSIETIKLIAIFQKKRVSGCRTSSIHLDAVLPAIQYNYDPIKNY